MAQESANSKTAADSADFDALLAQLASLRDEVAKLASTVAADAENRGQSLANDIAEGVSEAARYVESNGRTAEARLQSSIAANPLIALGLAAGAGLLLGALSRR